MRDSSAAQQGRFSLRCQVPEIGEVALGQGRFPWMVAGGKTVLAGTENPAAERAIRCAYADPRHLMKLRMAAGVAGSIAMAPEMLQQWITVEDDKPPASRLARAIRITAEGRQTVAGRDSGWRFRTTAERPPRRRLPSPALQGTVRFRGWQTNTVAPDALFEPPEGLPRREVDQVGSAPHLLGDAQFRRGANRTLAMDAAARLQPKAISVVARDPAGHGLLCRCQGKTILMLSGTPAQMGAAHGTAAGRRRRK